MEHLTEEQLLAVADGVAEDPHVDACPECGRAVAELRAARAALRAAPLLELPRRRVTDLVAALPDRRRERRLRGWPRAVVVAAPLAALAVAFLVVDADRDAPGGAGGGDDAAELSARGQADAERAQPELEAAPAQRVCRPPDVSTQTPLAEVRGPREEVVALLRAAGVDAVPCDGAVEVPSVDADRALELLARRPSGRVEVRTAP